jgi:hypothetical protein
MTPHLLATCALAAAAAGCAGRYPDWRTVPAPAPVEDEVLPRPWIPPPPKLAAHPSALDRIDPFPDPAPVPTEPAVPIDGVELVLDQGRVRALEVRVGTSGEIVRIARDPAGHLIAYRIDPTGALIYARHLTGPGTDPR